MNCTVGVISYTMHCNFTFFVVAISDWFSPLLREVFLRVLQFSPLLEN